MYPIPSFALHPTSPHYNRHTPPPKAAKSSAFPPPRWEETPPPNSQDALCTWYICRACAPYCNLQRQCRRLKCAFSPVVVIESFQAIHMQRDTCALRKALEDMWNHLTAQFTNLLPLEPEVNVRARAAGYVYNSAGERLVERSVGMAESGDPRQ